MNDNVIEGLARVEIEELDDTMFHDRYRYQYELLKDKEMEEKELHYDLEFI